MNASNSTNELETAVVPSGCVLEALYELPEGSDKPNPERLGEFYMAVLDWAMKHEVKA